MRLQQKDKRPASKILPWIFIGICAIAVNFSSLQIGKMMFGIDYADYYAAGKMVIDGNLAQIYNMQIHHAALERLFGSIPFLMEWIYPPTFLLPIVPLAYLPFHISLAVWLILTFVPAALAVYFLTDRNKFAWLGFLLYPGAFLNIRWGQNGFLSAALMGFGVYFLESNPMLAGLMFGLLTFKPQMALIPFIVLLLTKKWKALAWSSVFAAGFALLAGVVFGFDTWITFFSTAAHNASVLSSSWEGTNWGIPTLYTALRCVGVNGWPLYAILLAVAAAAFYACVRVWKATADRTLRTASLVICLFLTFPYLSLYDFAIFGVPFAMMVFDRFKNRKPSFNPLSLAMLWFLPIVCTLLFLLTKIQLCPLILMGYMALLVRYAEKKRDLTAIDITG